MLHYRDVVHHAGCFAVDVLTVPECIQDPLLAGEPCDHAGLDGAEVADHEAAAL